MGGFVQNAAIAIALYGAYISNPDEESFHRYLKDQMEKDKGSSSTWFERKVASLIAQGTCRRENYYVFSLMRIPVERVTYLGVYGNWFLLPPGLFSSHSSSSSSSSR